MVRPGIALYGYYPNARTRLEATVTFVRDVVPGESPSYLRAVKIDRPTRVATVGIGYSDGYPHVLAGKGTVLIGDAVTLIEDRRGSEAAADALAERSGGSDCKFLIGLNPELPRTYAGSAD